MLRTLPLLSLLLLPMAGCLEANDSLAEIEQGLWEEELVHAQVMRATCVGCTPTHPLGKPVTIQTSYHGYCEKGPFSDEYPCQPLPYTLAIECIGVPCSIQFLGSGNVGSATRVTPLAEGDVTVRVRMNDRELTFGAFPSLVPDRLEITCVHGADLATPCGAGFNRGPVELSFGLYDGDRLVEPDGPFMLETSSQGYSYGIHRERWRVHDVGEHVVTVSNGAFSATHTVGVSGTLPPVTAARSLVVEAVAE